MLNGLHDYHIIQCMYAATATLHNAILTKQCYNDHIIVELYEVQTAQLHTTQWHTDYVITIQPMQMLSNTMQCLYL